MTDQELAAVATAAPTPYVHEVVTACQNSGRSVAVVSNNSAAAVHFYLARHGLDDRISLVVARANHNPALLKPSPYLITQAVRALNAEPDECTLVGDSVTDVQAARLASVQSIGYANKPGKRERLTAAGAAVIINSLADLALRLRARVVDPELLRLPRRLQGHVRLSGPACRDPFDAQRQPGDRAVFVVGTAPTSFPSDSRFERVLYLLSFLLGSVPRLIIYFRNQLILIMSRLRDSSMTIFIRGRLLIKHLYRKLVNAVAKPIIFLAFALLAIAFLIFVIGVAPRLLYPSIGYRDLSRLGVTGQDAFVDQNDRLMLQNGARTALLQGLAGLAVLIGLYFTWRQVGTSRDMHSTDRFIRAVDQLGRPDKTTEVALGGIYGLERVARDSPADRRSIGEILTAYVRTRNMEFSDKPDGELRPFFCAHPMFRRQFRC